MKNCALGFFFFSVYFLLKYMLFKIRGFFFFFCLFWICYNVAFVLAPWPEIGFALPALEGKVLTTGQPGKCPLEVYLICNVVLVSGVPQSDSVIYKIYIPFHILSHYGLLLQDTEYSSLCYTVEPCLSILYIIVCIC